MTYPAASAGPVVLGPVIVGNIPVINPFFLTGTGRVGDPLTVNYTVVANPTATVTFQWKKAPPVLAGAFVISGDRGYTQYKPNALSTHVDASTATFHMGMMVTGSPADNKYPFAIEFPASGRILQGGLVLGDIPIGMDWDTWYHTYPGNSAAIRVEQGPLVQIRNWKITNCWDAMRLEAGCDGFLIENVWVDSCRDDAIENDHLNSGTIRNCLFEGSVCGMSTVGIVRAGQTVIFEDTLMSGKVFLNEGRVTHGPPFKANKDLPATSTNPDFRLRRTVVAIEDPTHNGSTGGDNRLEVAFSRMVEVVDCYFLNLSDTPLPGSYPARPAGFTTLQGAAARAYWNPRRAAFVSSF